MHSINIYWALTMCQALFWDWDTATNRTDATVIVELNWF